MSNTDMPNSSYSADAKTYLSWAWWKAVNKNGGVTLFRDKPVYRDPGIWIARGPVAEHCAFGKVDAPVDASVSLWPIDQLIARQA